MNAIRTLIIGAGGVGGYLGARLIESGADVTLLARGEHGRAIVDQGLTVRAERGEWNVRIPKLVSKPEQLSQRFDLILIAVKWPQLEVACDALPNLIAVDGVVVPLLNGLTSEDVVARYVGAQRTLSGVAYMSAGIVEPGVVYVNGTTRLGLAPYRPGQEAELARVASLFERAQVPLQRSDDFRTMLWQKMLWNAPFNGLCALARCSAGACVEHMEPELRRAMKEVISVARADGANLPEQMIDAMLKITRDEFPLTEPSMLQDVRKGRATEVEILQGEVVRRAAEHGVDVPVLATLAALIRALPAVSA